MKYINTLKIVTPVLLVGGALASIALADQSRNDQNLVHLPSSSPGVSLAPKPTITPSPSVSVTVNGKDVQVGNGVTQYNDGKAKVQINNSGNSVTTQTTSGPNSSTSVTRSDGGNVNVTVNSESHGGSSSSSTHVWSNGSTTSSTSQSTSVNSFSSP